MKIHLLDTDPRQYTDPTYLSNMGSFSIVAHGFNSALKQIGAYAEADEADFVGICDGLNLGFKYKNKKSFIINVWDCINVLPNELIQTKVNNPNLILLGLSNQITNLWQKSGFKCLTAMPGCDTKFWHQTEPKNQEFTFFFNSFANIRSGLELAVEAFQLSFPLNYSSQKVKLFITNTSSSPILQKYLDSKKQYCNLSYQLGKRISFNEMRTLYSQSHVSLNVMRHSSWGLNIHEAMACGCLPIIGNFCPSNEIVDNNHSIFLSPDRTMTIQHVAFYLKAYGLHNAYGNNFTYKEEPLIYGYSVAEYAQKMKDAYYNWNQYKEIDYRQFVVENWSWEKAALNLINQLKQS